MLQQIRPRQESTRPPLPDKQIIITTTGDKNIPPPILLQNEQPTDEILVPEAKGLNNMRLGRSARHADVLVPVACQNVPLPAVCASGNRGEHGDVAEQEGVLELRVVFACGGSGGGFLGEAELHAQFLVLERFEVALGVDGEFVGLGLEGLGGGGGGDASG